MISKRLGVVVALDELAAADVVARPAGDDQHISPGRAGARLEVGVGLLERKVSGYLVRVASRRVASSVVVTVKALGAFGIDEIDVVDRFVGLAGSASASKRCALESCDGFLAAVGLGVGAPRR